MNGYSILSLKDMLEVLGESEVKAKLSSFSCPMNRDVEYFLRHKAIEFAKQAIAPTSLVYASYKGEWVLCGYFTITMKAFTVKKDVGSTIFRRLKKFGTYNEELKSCHIPAPLIAQLGKNFTNGYDGLIKGRELLELACIEIRKIQAIGGGKIVYLECEDKPKLTQFYYENGFREFAKRQLDKDEQDKLSGQYLVQMLKYLD
ncbi:MAG: N-acetyltransferase [Oscillospiraceae bacterium]